MASVRPSSPGWDHSARTEWEASRLGGIAFAIGAAVVAGWAMYLHVAVWGAFLVVLAAWWLWTFAHTSDDARALIYPSDFDESRTP